ncbi:MAG: hypothetical protein CBC12_00555 [Candidatus Puniceispirillum sp. TMED52]|jgi:hypothetical protein|nr:MAG: hypothetical protein CBC12_00555 [Candidatus Puniceispirillum sp. TMED52]|tara:strand:- start:1149 stop:1547 length:399 start_codon:yes stop_codon:yes gene_type:complete
MVTFGDTTVIPFVQEEDEVQLKTHFSEGDTLAVFWETESWHRRKEARWVNCMVVSCLKDKEVYAIYPENSLSFYFGRNHNAVYVLQNLEGHKWEWAHMPAEWEYDVACAHKANVGRVGGRHVVYTYERSRKK